ncbi:Protein of unknown function DUF4246 [Penicillium bovifimosum]|uniref:Uncharacterized protein n=1 Tax=Penicillium bovifimosum TaxID=126998 RepID=A0A9W9L9R8_9EURO|nr:Protein of unknown function DUF4246 [Penicillium bovifimosum]KAJ5143732.1 Protein of unknown function DUF4246 [Penicillium bovifimosum]
MFQQPGAHPSKLQARSAEDARFSLPGFNRPLDFAPREKNIYGVECRSMFPSALDDRDIQAGHVDLPVCTLRELHMVSYMEDLTDIPEWWEKVFDPTVQEQWKKDAMNSGKDITLNMAEWIIDELQFKAMIYQTTGVVSLYNGDVTKSDTNMSEKLIRDIKAMVPELAYADERLKECYSGVILSERDYLSVAMYPLVYGKSRILTDRLIGVDDALQYAGKGEVIPVPQDTGITREDIAWRVVARADIQVRPYSRHYQLLPSDWEFGDDGKWHIASYINNLHPVKHRNVYKVIEEAFNCVVPQWNATLTPLKDMLHSRARIEYAKAEYYPVPKELAAQPPQIQAREAQSEFDERLEKWRMENMRVIQPDVGKFIPWAVPPWMMDKLPRDLPSGVRIENSVDLNRDYQGRGLQVITRILSIELDPENPTYETDFHVEGTMNEHVCATAFLVYDHQNTHDAYMEFRNIIETDMLSEIEHEPNDFVWLQQVFGLRNNEPAVQRPGTIRARPGRVIMCPSVVQHKFSFALKDTTKPGYSSAMVFFLVDPNIRIISTANIPPQRVDWTMDIPESEGGIRAAMEKLALDNMKNKDDMPMSLEEAAEMRAAAVKEMLEFTRYQHVAFESKILNL